MEKKVKELVERVDRLLAVLHSLKAENENLREENDRVTTELTGLREAYNNLRLEQADRSEAVTSRLTSVLHRLDELERMHQ